MEMDLKVVAHAKEYLDALAKGIDPLSGEVIPEGEVVRQERLIKCFEYISKLLDAVIENGGIEAKPTEQEPFNAQNIDVDRFTFSEEPITIMGFVKRLNSCCPDSMQGTSYYPILSWLEKHQYLQRIVVEETRKKSHFTLGDKAAEIGIVEENRETRKGVFSTVVYPAEAQHFLISKLMEIQNETPPPRENKGKKWSSEEDGLLLSLWEKGSELSQIADQLQRSQYAIQKRLEKLFAEKLNNRELSDEAKKRMNELGRKLAGETD